MTYQPLLERAATGSQPLADLLEAWELHPAAEIAEAIGAAPLALEAIVSEDAVGGTQRLGALERRRDPRIAAQLVAWCATPPWHATGAQPFYRELFARLVLIADPRSIASLPKAKTAMAKKIKGASMRTWMGNQIGKCAAAIAARYPEGVPALAAKQRALVTKAGKAIAAGGAAVIVPVKQSRATVAADALLAAIHANPHDDAPRQVYADVLSEKGDPRGEFITMQLARSGRAPTPAEKVAELKALKKHAKTWLAEISPMLTSMAQRLQVGPQQAIGSIGFERGFLTSMFLGGREKDIERCVGASVLATLENLALDRHGAIVLERAQLPALRRLRVPQELVSAISASPIAAQLEELQLEGAPSPEARDAIPLLRAFPTLHALAIRFFNNDPVTTLVATVRAAVSLPKVTRIRVTLANASQITLVRDPTWRFDLDKAEETEVTRALRALVA